MRHLHGLCAFFGVPIGYFFDEEIEARVDDQLEWPRRCVICRSPAGHERRGTVA